MIRNKNSMKGSERVIAETGKLIETLKKVGVIPTKKSRRVRQTALADAQLEGMPLQGILPTLPRATYPSQQLDFNAQRLEDIQRGAAQALALYRGQKEPDADVGDRFGVMNQGIQTDMDETEFEGRFGANKPQGKKLDFDTPKPEIFFGEGEGDEVAGTVETGGGNTETAKQAEKIYRTAEEALANALPGQKVVSYYPDGPGGKRERVRTEEGKKASRESEAKRRQTTKFKTDVLLPAARAEAQKAVERIQEVPQYVFADE